MDSLDNHVLRAMLEWQVDLGVTEATVEAPVNRYDAGIVATAAAPDLGARSAGPGVGPVAKLVFDRPGDPGADAVALARRMADGAADLAALRAALAAFEGCELKKGARNLVFSDGNSGARVMVIGEAPGREEDLQGLPFVGPAGQMLDRMFAAVGLARGAATRETAIYITNILPWRPPQNRDPAPEEIAMMMPFVARHVALIGPDVLVLMGNISCAGVLGQKGITRLRGQWATALGCPVLPMFHPAYLLRNPAAKREAWADLLALQAHLRGHA